MFLLSQIMIFLDYNSVLSNKVTHFIMK